MFLCALCAVLPDDVCLSGVLLHQVISKLLCLLICAYAADIDKSVSKTIPAKLDVSSDACYDRRYATLVTFV